MKKVAVKKCEDYEDELLQSKLQELLKLLGGIERFVSPGQKVLLKVNLVVGRPPGAAVTTHPLVLEKLIKIIQDVGASVIIGDSPGGIFTAASLKKAYKKSGLLDIAKKTGAKLNYNTKQLKVNFPAGKVSKHFIISEFIKEADVIINLPKLKTHGLTKYTGAVKNLFGAIPGLLKAEYHLKMPDVDIFSNLLIDLALLINPVLHIMDGIMGMEGEGPSGGKPRKFGYLLASESSFALDTAAIHLMAIKPPASVPLIKELKNRNIVANINDIELIGDRLIPAKNVEIPIIERSSNLLDRKLPGFIDDIAQYLLRPRPEFNYERCTACGDCMTNCPVGAISFKNEKPEVELNKCIRCFCCQELCEFQAINIKRPLPGRLIFGS